jgi:hypothetical protein
MKKQFLVSVVLLVLMITVSKPSLTQSLLHLASCVGSACVALGPPTAAELASDDGSIQYTYGTGGTATTQHVNASMYAGLSGTQDVLGLYKWEIGHTIFKAIACSGLPTPSAGYGDYCFDTSKTFKWKDDTGTLNSFGGGAPPVGGANAVQGTDGAGNFTDTGLTATGQNLYSEFGEIHTGTSNGFYFGHNTVPQGGIVALSNGIFRIQSNGITTAIVADVVTTNNRLHIKNGTNTGDGFLDSGSGSIPALPTSTDPGCTAAGHIGRMWVDNTSSVTTHFKVCAEVASNPAWVTVF